jgi:Holliday junction resolvasome RuvABC endonuclease subunit
MSTVPCALGFDPGFASFGYAVVELGRASDRVVKLGVIVTQKDSKKKAVLAADDNVRRCEEIAGAIVPLLQEHRVVCLCAESMSFPRHSSSAAKVAMAWGVIATLAFMHKLPLAQCSPQVLKKNLCGTRDASKEDVQAALIKTFPYLPGLLSKLAKGKHEHAYDALGSVIAVQDFDVLRMARSML